MRHLLIVTALIAMLGTVAAACGSGGPGEIIVFPGNSELVVGPNRFALALLEEDNTPILEEPGTSVDLRFFYEDELRGEYDASFTWAIPESNGFFVANVDFDEAGEWELETLGDVRGWPCSACSGSG